MLLPKPCHEHDWPRRVPEFQDGERGVDLGFWRIVFRGPFSVCLVLLLICNLAPYLMAPGWAHILSAGIVGSGFPHRVLYRFAASACISSSLYTSNTRNRTL